MHDSADHTDGGDAAGHDHHGHDHHGHDHGRFGPLRALGYLLLRRNGVGNAFVLTTAEVTEGDVVLDVGSGAGTAVIDAVTRHGAVRAIGVEPARVLRRAADWRARLRRVGNRTEFHDGTAEALPVGDASVDVVVAVNSVHHWEDVDKGLAEVARVLRPGGRFVTSDEDFSHGDHPRGNDPHADWPGVDYDRVTAVLARHGMDVATRRDTADGVPIMAVVARMAQV